MKVPCITLRGETEWVETLKGNWNVLSALTTEDIYQKAMHTVVDAAAHEQRPFGDGNASQKIATVLSQEMGIQP